MYVARYADNLIGLSTTPLGIGSTGGFSGIGTNLNISGIGSIVTLNSTDISAVASRSTWGQVSLGFTAATGIITNFSAGIATITELIGGSARLSGVTTTGNLFVSGISTLGTISINSGIITATSGIVTYYGSGQNLTGLVTSISAGSGILVSQSQGQVTVSATSPFAGIGIYNVASTVSGNSQYIAFNTHEGNQTAGERMRIRQNGAIIMGGAANTQHLNEVLSVNHGANVQALVLRSSDASYTTVQGVYRIVRANNSAYRFAQWDSSDGGDTEFYLRGDGQAYADGSWNGGGADYAEYFEWADGNIENEDRVGYSVALVDNKIKIAEEGDTIIGVISGSPSVVGDHASNKWDKKYLKDDFSRYLRDENGDRILNPEYDSELEYVSRESRPEWAIVGLMGKLRLRKGQVTGAGWIKMRD
ncbi:MAG: hypothetical protein EB127_28650, partial [Alphaproteobacteria bacterium]|nr:hypothetical protein [Alphaproteobacteria bacterium]